MSIFLTLVLLVSAINSGEVTVAHSSDYPAQEFSFRRRRPGGYEIDSPMDKASVIFPAEGWKSIDRTFPGGGYVVDPATGTTFRFYSIRFGRRLREFLLWGWTTAEHHWAQQWQETNVSVRNQGEFLQEWLNRTLVRREISHPDELSIVVPTLGRDLASAQLCPLCLIDPNAPFRIQIQKIEGHDFSYVKLPTYVIVNDQRRYFESEVRIGYFRYIPKFEQWQFYVAFSHIPSDLSPERKTEMRELFMKTLRSLSITFYKGD